MNSREVKDVMQLINRETQRMTLMANSDDMKISTHHIANLLSQVAQLAQYVHQEQE